MNDSEMEDNDCILIEPNDIAENYNTLNDENYIIPNEDRLFQNVYKKRADFSKFVNDLNTPDKKNLYMYIIVHLVNPFNTETSAVWIGGSRSWENVYNEQFKETDLSKATKSAVTTAGNYDIFMLFQDRNEMINAFEQCQKTVRHLVRMLGTKLRDYNIHIEYPKGPSSPKNDTNLEMCALFPCKSIAVNITGPTKQRNTRDDSRKNMPSEGDTLRFNNKLLLYMEFSYEPHFDVKTFKREFLNFPYLNAKGLFLFSQFIINERKDKGINVDGLREKFLTNEITKGENPKKISEVMYDVALFYKIIFSDKSNIHKDFLTTLYVKAVYQQYKEEEKRDLNKLFTYVIMETVRPLINTCVSMLHHLLKDKIDVYKAFLMISGGDAMRRYGDGIAPTNDIDTKVYFDKTLSKKKKIEFLNYITSFMVIMVTMLNSSYASMDQEFYNHVNKYNLYEIKIPKIKLGNNTNKQYNLFRLRYIEAYEEFPVDLFSIDLQFPVCIKTNTPLIDNQPELKTFMSIPIFDLVVQPITVSHENTIEKYRAHYVNEFDDTNLPIASRDFLIEDIISTQTDEDKMRMRVSANKEEQDNNRLTMLRESTQDEYITTLDNLLFHIPEILTKDLQEQISAYYQKFKYRIRSNRCSRRVKHKMPFSLSNIEKLTIPENKASIILINYSELKRFESSFRTARQQGGGTKHRLAYGEQIAKYIKKLDTKLYRSIMNNPIVANTSLMVDKYIIDFMHTRNY
jgi:hypothetical protein